MVPWDTRMLSLLGYLLFNQPEICSGISPGSVYRPRSSTAYYRIFSKDQRVSHTAVVENKRLRHALATVKAQQDTKHLP